MCVLDVIRGTIWLSCSKNEDWSSIRFKRIRRITENPVVIIDKLNKEDGFINNILLLDITFDSVVNVTRLRDAIWNKKVYIIV